VRLLVLGERSAPVVFALLGTPAAAASAAAAPVVAGWLRLSAAIAAPLVSCGAVQLFADELDDDAADELGDGAAQLVFDERLERSLRRRGHTRSLRRSSPSDVPTMMVESRAHR